MGLVRTSLEFGGFSFLRIDLGLYCKPLPTYSELEQQEARNGEGDSLSWGLLPQDLGRKSSPKESCVSRLAGGVELVLFLGRMHFSRILAIHISV